MFRFLVSSFQWAVLPRCAAAAALLAATLALAQQAAAPTPTPAPAAAPTATPEIASSVRVPAEAASPAAAVKDATEAPKAPPAIAKDAPAAAKAAPALGARPLLLKSGLISGGLSVSLSQAGVPDAVALTLVRELSQAFNVDEDVAADDKFAVLFEAPLLAGSNANAAPPKLMAFEYTHVGKLYAAYWFDVSDAVGDESYFLADGSSLRPAFLRTPIELVRVTSGFGARKVPRRKQWRNHDGVDFGAPIGTRIFAAADGKIEVMRQERGFGKVVKLSHAKNATTIYGHMSAFVAGLGVGSEVKQGDVIGFVGRTGWATGPHLHYEYRVDNKPIDPFSNDFPTSQSVPPARMDAFNAQVAAMQARFALMKRAALDAQPAKAE